MRHPFDRLNEESVPSTDKPAAPTRRDLLKFAGLAMPVLLAPACKTTSGAGEAKAGSDLASVTSFAVGEEGGGQGWVTSQAIGEEGGDNGWVTSQSLGEEGGGNGWISTQAVGEEGGEFEWVSTEAVGEEGGGNGWVSTQAVGEEGGGGGGLTFRDFLNSKFVDSSGRKIEFLRDRQCRGVRQSGVYTCSWVFDGMGRIQVDWSDGRRFWYFPLSRNRICFVGDGVYTGVCTGIMVRR